jgi:hypothetical protein
VQQIAEARAFAAIAPHLIPSKFFQALIGRPVKALDLSSLELWYVQLPEREHNDALRLFHEPPNGETLHRVLWLLPHIGVLLSDRERDRLAELAISEDQLARLGAVRVAVVSKDESLGSRMVALGLSVKPGMGWREENWVTLLLGSSGGDLTFGDLAKRLRPSTIGFVLGQRGNRLDEVEIYAACLDQEWRAIVSAEDPGLARLPEVTLQHGDDDPGVRFPELYEPTTPRTIRLDRSNSWTSGPPLDPGLDLKEIFSNDYEAQLQRLNEDRRRRIDAILSAWGTDAFRWYGRTFDVEAMDVLYQQQPARVGGWVQSAIADSSAGFAVRIRLAGFLEPICRVLLNRNPQLGLQLWQALRKREDSPIVFDMTDIAFSADTTESKLARQAICTATCFGTSAPSHCLAARRIQIDHIMTA